MKLAALLGTKAITKMYKVAYDTLEKKPAYEVSAGHTKDGKVIRPIPRIKEVK